MLSSCQVHCSGQYDGVAGTVAGDVVQWVLANDGSVSWPEGSTLRLVGGPVLASPVVEVPPLAPQQTVVVDLEVSMPPDCVNDAAEAFYALVTPNGQPFGELVHLQVVRKLEPAAGTGADNAGDSAPPAPGPCCVVLAAPGDGSEGGLEALQGELKSVEWTLANPGPVAWPDDVVVELFYNTPGLELPGKMELPAGEVLPGMTVQVQVAVFLPEVEGSFKAMWAVTSASTPDFGEVLYVEFKVGDFPFMEWMLAEAAQAGSISDATELQDGEEGSEHADEEHHEALEKTTVHEVPKLSAALALQQHHVATASEVSVSYAEEDSGESGCGMESLGRIRGLAPGTPWLLELVLVNDGNVPWPAGVELRCCFGPGLGCPRLPLVSDDTDAAVQPGQAVQVALELEAPAAPVSCAWVLAAQDACFGPAFVLQVL